MSKFFRIAAKSVAAVAAGMLLCASASATLLSSKISVDNGFAVYISTNDSVAGTLFGSGSDWTNAVNSSTTLTAGTNYFLHLYGYDTGGIAAFLGQFSLSGTDHKFANGTTTLATGTSGWTGNTTGFGPSYTAVTDLGANGVAPWGKITGIGNSAHWIWSGDADANDVSYFSAQILATTAGSSGVVPEPATVALLGLGLFGVAMSRRKAGQR